MNRSDVHGCLAKGGASRPRRAAAVLALAASLCGCASMEVERDGELFPSTRTTWCGEMSTLPAYIFLTGYCYPPTGIVFYPVGLACHAVEAFAIAPVVDVVCLPYDLTQRPSYLEKERAKKEKEEADRMVFWELDKALSDPRYTAPTNTVQRDALSRSLDSWPRDDLTREQTERIFAAIVADPDLMPVLGGLAGARNLDPDKLDIFVDSAIRMRESGAEDDADRLAKAICSSPNLTDEQYARLLSAGFSEPLLKRMLKKNR